MNLVRDYETWSLLDLPKVGTHRYTTDESTRITCMAYALDDSDIKLWHPGDPVPPEFIEVAKNKNARAIAHNAAFEMGVERNIMGPRYGFPVIPPEQNICTMAAAVAMALPAKLETCARALKLDERKDHAGRRAMMQVTKPRRTRQSEDEEAGVITMHWYGDKERLALVDRYCMQDVALERELFDRLYMLSSEEFDLWLLDQRINNYGFRIDLALAHAATTVVEEAYRALDKELFELTDGKVKTVNQVQQMRNWLLTEFKIEAPDLDKSRVELLLGSVKDERAHRLLEIRQLGARAAVKKINAFLLRCADDDRVRGEFMYHAAGTGRWSSRGVQVHNLKRLPDDFDYEAAIKIVGEGDYNLVCKTYLKPLETVGTLLRPLIIAEPKYELWGADFSGIEARITAWLADDENQLDVFRKYDAGLGPDPYIVTAAEIFKKDPATITKEERTIGKACFLAFGFGGGVNAFYRFSAGNFTEEEVIEFRDAWRNARQKICNYWYALNEAFWDAMRAPNIPQTAQRRTEVLFDPDSFCLPILWMTLPSQRQIVYPDIKIRRPMPYELLEDNARDSRGIYFQDNTQGRWFSQRIWHGLLVENAVQGIARDLLAGVLKQLDHEGFKIVTHTHDEVCVEEPKTSKRFKQFTAIMNHIPVWANGLPIVAKAWRDTRYVK